jgi:hypothetical protein
MGSGSEADPAPAAPVVPHWAVTPADPIDVGASTDTAPEHLRSLRTAAMITAGVAATHAVLFLASFWLMSSVPGAGASTAELLEYYASAGERRVVIVGMYLMPFAGIAFIWFIVAMRMWVQSATRRVSVLMSNVQLVSGILYVGLLFVAAAAQSVLAFSIDFGDGSADDVEAHQFPVFSASLTLVFALRMAAMFVITTSTIGRASGVLPRWFIYGGYVVGIFLLLTATLQSWFALVFPAWLLGLSVILWTRARQVSPELMIARTRPAQVMVVPPPGDARPG